MSLTDRQNDPVSRYFSSSRGNPGHFVGLFEKMTRSNPAEEAVAFPSSLGWMAAIWTQLRLSRLTFGHRSGAAALKYVGNVSIPTTATVDAQADFVARLQAYAEGQSDDFLDVTIDRSHLTPFARRVIDRCRRIPYGQTITYAELASAAGSPGAARAVGNVMAANRVPLIVPCHRVVASGGSLGGYSAPAGLDMKRRLLVLEEGLDV